MKYFAEFDSDGNRTAGYVADGMPYTEADIRERFPNAIEISEDDQEKYVTGQYIRDSETGKPVEKPAHVPTIEEKIAALDAEYQPQFSELTQAWATASMDGNTDLAASIKTDKDSLIAEYQAKREATMSGN